MHPTYLIPYIKIYVCVCVCVRSGCPCLCSYPVASYGVIGVKQVSEMPPKQPLGANVMPFPKDPVRRLGAE